MLGRFYEAWLDLTLRQPWLSAQITDRKQLTLVSSERRQEAPTPGHGLSFDTTLQVADVANLAV